MSIWDRIKCRLGWHDYHKSRFQALGSTSFPYQCSHCKKVVYLDKPKQGAMT